MSFIGLQEVVDNCRVDMERAGVRGIDLDYILDPRVDHANAMRALEEVVSTKLARWRDIRRQVTEQQWAYYEVCDPDIRELVILRRAGREVKKEFEAKVLKLAKDAGV